jgi:serine/threonine protein phosphatase 1
MGDIIMIYLMSDIHGDYKRFQRMLKKIKLGVDDRLYILGDIIGRGTENLDMLEFCMNESNIYLIKGDHELFMQLYLENSSIDISKWKQWDGQNTINELKNVTDKEKKMYVKYLKELPFYIEICEFNIKYILTHSGYNADIDSILNDDGKVDTKLTIEKSVNQDERNYLISKDIHYIPAGIKFDRYIIVGHHTTIRYGEDKIMKNKRYMNINCGNSIRDSGGKLSCICLDTMQEWYV